VRALPYPVTMPSSLFVLRCIVLCGVCCAARRTNKQTYQPTNQPPPTHPNRSALAKNALLAVADLWAGLLPPKLRTRENRAVAQALEGELPSLVPVLLKRAADASGAFLGVLLGVDWDR
jgi:hypothetical protein